jgi:hypothetical protein
MAATSVALESSRTISLSGHSHKTVSVVGGREHLSSSDCHLVIRDASDVASLVARHSQCQEQRANQTLLKNAQPGLASTYPVSANARLCGSGKGTISLLGFSILWHSSVSTARVNIHRPMRSPCHQPHESGRRLTALAAAGLSTFRPARAAARKFQPITK